MKRWRLFLLTIVLIIAVALASSSVRAAASTGELVEICTALFADVFGVPNGEPLGVCQWNMALINATGETYQAATGEGVTVGIIDSGIDPEHPDIAPNLDLDRSCSFIFSDTPSADPSEVADGDCSNKAAIDDLYGHGTYVASLAAAPVNGVGIAGVAPEATIVALKACTAGGLCFVDSVAAALRYAADNDIDIVNLSLFADPYLYYCKSESEQRAMLKELESAASYARRNGVLLVASAGNEQADLRHPIVDDISPDWPPDSAEVRYVKNNCRVAPAELPGVLTVSATGPIGIPDYDMWVASYSSVGNVDVAAPGGDYFAATGTVQDAVLGAVPFDSVIWQVFDPLEQFFPGLTVVDQGAAYAFLNGTSAAAPHATGVAALIKELHPDWGPGALAAAVRRSAWQLPCPPDWQPLDPEDERLRCYGNNGWTSFFGHGLVDAEAAVDQ